MSNNFGTRQNNDYSNEARKSSTNTRIYQFKNKDGFEPSTLQITGWDEMCSLRINPALEPSKQSREQVFDYERFVATSLNMEKAMLLLYKINNDILPAIEKEEEKNIGINVGGDSLITVGTGKKLTGSIRPYIAIHKSLNPDTKKPEQSIYYEFKKSMTIDDYDEQTGEYTVNEGYHAEFKLFTELLKSFITVSNFGGHSARYNMKYTLDKLLSNTSNGSSSGTGFKSGGFGSRKSVFGGGSSGSNYESAESTAIESIGDLNDLMND